MFERFTPESNKCIHDARAVATALGQDQIGSEHLLAAIASQDGPAQKALAAEGLTADSIVAHLDRGEASPSGKLPFTLDAKTGMEYALRQALSMGHNYIAPYHLLLGIANVESEEGAAQVLNAALGCDERHARVGALHDPIVRYLNAEHQANRTDLDRRTSTARRHSEQLRKLIKHTGNPALIAALNELTRLASTPIGDDAADREVGAA
jgi:ATP-dependent Clp protease ATP-binding subunit ClpA